MRLFGGGFAVNLGSNFVVKVLFLIFVICSRNRYRNYDEYIYEFQGFTLSLCGLFGCLGAAEFWKV